MQFVSCDYLFVAYFSCHMSWEFYLFIFYLLPNLLLIQNWKGNEMSFLENQFSTVVWRTLHTCEVFVTDVIFKFYISSLECDCCTVTSTAIGMLFV